MNTRPEKPRQRKRDFESASNNNENEQEKAGKKQLRPVIEYRVWEIWRIHEDGSIISEIIREVKSEEDDKPIVTMHPEKHHS